MSGGADEMTPADLNIKLIEELSGVRGDIREILVKLDRTSDDIKEIKTVASEAMSCANGADVKAQRAMDEIVQIKANQQEQERVQRSQKQWLTTSLIAIAGVIVALVSIFI